MLLTFIYLPIKPLSISSKKVSRCPCLYACMCMCVLVSLSRTPSFSLCMMWCGMFAVRSLCFDVSYFISLFLFCFCLFSLFSLSQNVVVVVVVFFAINWMVFFFSILSHMCVCFCVLTFHGVALDFLNPSNCSAIFGCRCCYLYAFLAMVMVCMSVSVLYIVAIYISAKLFSPYCCKVNSFLYQNKIYCNGLVGSKAWILAKKREKKNTTTIVIKLKWFALFGIELKTNMKLQSFISHTHSPARKKQCDVPIRITHTCTRTFKIDRHKSSSIRYFFFFFGRADFFRHSNLTNNIEREKWNDKNIAAIAISFAKKKVELKISWYEDMIICPILTNLIILSRRKNNQKPSHLFCSLNILEHRYDLLTYDDSICSLFQRSLYFLAILAQHCALYWPGIVFHNTQ